MPTKKTILIGLLVLALALAGFAGAAFAQTPTPAQEPPAGQAEPPRTISVTGSGVAYLTPDLAYINIGVHTENASAEEAVAENSADTEEVIAAIREFGIDERDIQTTNFSIWPQQRYGNDGQPTGEITYVVDNTVMVTVRDLDQIGELLNAVVDAGSNQINGIQFDVADKAAALATARTAAVAEARQIASELAEAAGVELGEIQAISTGVSAPSPVFGGAELARLQADASVPVARGQMTVQVDVNVVFAIE